MIDDPQSERSNFTTEKGCIFYPIDPYTSTEGLKLVKLYVSYSSSCKILLKRNRAPASHKSAQTKSSVFPSFTKSQIHAYIHKFLKLICFHHAWSTQNYQVEACAPAGRVSRILQAQVFNSRTVKFSIGSLSISNVLNKAQFHYITTTIKYQEFSPSASSHHNIKHTLR